MCDAMGGGVQGVLYFIWAGRGSDAHLSAQYKEGKGLLW